MPAVLPEDEARTLALAADLADDFEGYRAEPYRCPAGVWTIGFGSTRDSDGNPVSARTAPISRTFATLLMERDMRAALTAVQNGVRIPLWPEEAAALVSFIYNVGVGRFTASSLLRKLNARDMAGAAAEFDRWNMGGGQVLAGLIRRRDAEEALFRG